MEKKFHVGVKAVIVNNKKVLILKTVNSKGVHMYDLPGGRINEKESIQEAFERELKEELGIKLLSIGPLIGAFERGDYYSKDKDTSLMLLFYTVKANAYKLKLSNEHYEFRWISKKDLQEIIKNHENINKGIVDALESVL